MIYTPLHYQERAEQHAMDNAKCGLFLDMGLGKTVTTLTVLKRKLYDTFEVGKVLIIAPKFVCTDTWPKEIMKWDHTRDLKYSVITGNEKQRRAAIKAQADIYIINKEMVVWLVTKVGLRWPYDMVVVDELSTFKNHSSKRFLALKQVLPGINHFIGLTGTPTPKSLLDLWSQMYLIDKGERLGKNITAYREAYFKSNTYSGFTKYESSDKDKEQIYDLIKDVVISMRAEDYAKLPERIDRHIRIEFDADNQQAYKNFERDKIIEMQGEEITAMTAGVLVNKLVQFCNGAIYTKKPEYIEVHNQKIEALKEIVEAANGHPVLVFYSFQSDKARIEEALARYKPISLKQAGAIDRWNKKEIAVALAHPGSAGHGLNLQAGGNIIVWFGIPWSLEYYMQANARLHRMGQTEVVIIHHLTISGSVEDDILASLSEKENGQNRLLNAVKARVKDVLSKVHK